MRKSIYFLSFLLATIAAIEPAYAQDALFASGTNFLEALESLLTGTWARIAAIIAIVILGFGWMMGRISWHVAGAVVGGIILVFGAAAIVDGISGSI